MVTPQILNGILTSEFDCNGKPEQITTALLIAVGSICWLHL
jgi:hypothetical protein